MPGDVVIVHAGETPPSEWDASVFLAGPVPRDPDVPSWHPEAIALLRKRWAGPGRLTVFAPEPRGGVAVEGTHSMAWEEAGLRRCDVVLFWIPRDMSTMPGLTTNIEWGIWHASGKAVLGVPPEAVGVDYPLEQARDHGVPTASTLAGAVDHALAAVGTGARRRGGETEAPLALWRAPGFERWYTARREAGDALLGARLEWASRAGTGPGGLDHWAARVRLRLPGDQAADETLIAAPDTARLVLYRPAPRSGDTVVALLCGRPCPADPLHWAAETARAALGQAFEPERLRDHGSRRIAPAPAVHHAHLVSAEITETELERLRADGRAAASLAELHTEPEPDWAVLGMIAQVLG